MLKGNCRYNKKDCNEGYTTAIAYIDRDEGEALLAKLFGHLHIPAFLYRHKRNPGYL